MEKMGVMLAFFLMYRNHYHEYLLSGNSDALFLQTPKHKAEQSCPNIWFSQTQKLCKNYYGSGKKHITLLPSHFHPL